MTISDEARHQAIRCICASIMEDVRDIARDLMAQGASEAEIDASMDAYVQMQASAFMAATEDAERPRHQPPWPQPLPLKRPAISR